LKITFEKTYFSTEGLQCVIKDFACYFPRLYSELKD
jgi:hypothetical protein